MSDKIIDLVILEKELEINGSMEECGLVILERGDVEFMKVVIAPDSFKESMTALEVATAIEIGFLRGLPTAECVKVPMADGGEGTVQSLVDATQGSMVYQQVTGPLGSPVDAFYGLTGDGKTGIIEMAAASGIDLITKEDRNPMKTTSRGTGELILCALDMGVDHLIIGLGGSVTNDGGVGMAQALGAQIIDENGQMLVDGGGALSQLDSIDVTHLDPRLAKVTIDVACDVDNPLTGERGASVVFGPQKGATEEMVPLLDTNLNHYAHILKRDLGKNVDAIEGAGAAGGMGAGLMAFSNAQLKRGVDIVIDAVGLAEVMEGASLVVTGEGKIDSQTSSGKTPMGVAQVANKLEIPVIGIGGMVDFDSKKEENNEHGLDAAFSIVPGPVSLEDAMENSIKYTEALAENIARLVQLTI